MRLYSRTLLSCLVIHSVSGIALSAPFQNLDFEGAVFAPGEGLEEYLQDVQYAHMNGLPIPEQPLPIDPLPHWELSPTYVWLSYNSPSCLGGACLHVRQSLYTGEAGLFFQGGADPNGNIPGATGLSISQTGDIPATAKSIRLVSTWETHPGGGSWTSYENLGLAIDGVSIPLAPIQFFDNHDLGYRAFGKVLLGANIEALAGTSVELTISTRTPQPLLELWARLDDVSFSSQPIPEPSTVKLFLIAAFLPSRRFRSSRSLRTNLRSSGAR